MACKVSEDENVGQNHRFMRAIRGNLRIYARLLRNRVSWMGTASLVCCLEIRAPIMPAVLICEVKMSNDSVTAGDGGSGTIIPGVDVGAITSEEQFIEVAGDLIALMIFSDLILDDLSDNA